MKIIHLKGLNLLIFFLFLSAGLYAQPASLERNLIAHFPLHESPADSSRYKLQAEVFGAELKKGVRCGQAAYYFDGKDDYIDYGQHRIFSRPLSGMSVSFWVQPTYNEYKEDFLVMLVGKWAFEKEKDQFGVFLNGYNKVVMSVGDGVNNGKGVFSSMSLRPHIWYHVVAKWEAPNRISIYVNGRLNGAAAQEGTNGFNTNSDVSIKIGRQVVNRSRAFNGFLSGVRMYSRALSDPEIRELYEFENGICQKFILEGEVINANTFQPIESSADVFIKDLETGEDVIELKSDEADGYFRTELPTGKQYGIFAKAKDYRYISVNQFVDTRDVKVRSVAGVPQEVVMKRDLLMVPFEVGGKVRVNNIFFATGKSDLQEESFPELNFLAQLFTDIPGMVLEIGGHTDNVGSDDLNQRLSADRANSVRNYLITKGVAENRVKAAGYGESMPVAENETEEGRQKNRRVEFTILEK